MFAVERLVGGEFNGEDNGCFESGSVWLFGGWCGNKNMIWGGRVDDVLFLRRKRKKKVIAGEKAWFRV